MALLLEMSTQHCFFTDTAVPKGILKEQKEFY